jgi:hypothetical protein
LTQEQLQNLREAAARDFLTRDQIAGLFREVDQLLRDNQSLADGLNDWRERCQKAEARTNRLQVGIQAAMETDGRTDHWRDVLTDVLGDEPPWWTTESSGSHLEQK